MSDKPSLAELERAVDLAEADDRGPCWQMNLNYCLQAWLAALRVERERGMVSVQLHKTTLEMVRDANDCFSVEDARERLWSEVRFLAAALKG